MQDGEGDRDQEHAGQGRLLGHEQRRAGQAQDDDRALHEDLQGVRVGIVPLVVVRGAVVEAVCVVQDEEQRREGTRGHVAQGEGQALVGGQAIERFPEKRTKPIIFRLTQIPLRLICIIGEFFGRN